MNIYQWRKVEKFGVPFEDAKGKGFIYEGKRRYLLKYGPTITGPDYRELEGRSGASEGGETN
jgi:hypothetical protein